MAWTAPTTRTTGDLITASIWNTDLVDNLNYLKTNLDNLNVCSQADVTSSRAIGTIYQNTSGKIKIVGVTVAAYSSSTNSELDVSAVCGASTPPLTNVVQNYSVIPITNVHHRVPVTFVVPKNYYYQIARSYIGTGTPFISEWIEWTLH